MLFGFNFEKFYHVVKNYESLPWWQQKWIQFRAFLIRGITGRRALFDGVFDRGPHESHLKKIRTIHLLGYSVYVGVPNDADTTAYKREPWETMEVRGGFFRYCQYVTRVIFNTPTTITKDFLLQHKINAVFRGNDFNEESLKKYYPGAVALNIIKTLPYDNEPGGISSSDQAKRDIARVLEKYRGLKGLNIVITGPQGCGKGHTSRHISSKLGIPHISPGDMLRAEIAKQTELGQQAKTYMDAGSLVPIEVMQGIILARLSLPDCARGFILDGFPRDKAQAEALEGIKIDMVIILEATDEQCIDVISGRLIHKASGRTYHRTILPPKQEGLDDITGEPLEQREDDQDTEAIKKRLSTYREQTAPVFDGEAPFGAEHIIRLNAFPFNELGTKIEAEVQSWLIEKVFKGFYCK